MFETILLMVFFTLAICICLTSITLTISFVWKFISSLYDEILEEDEEY